MLFNGHTLMIDAYKIKVVVDIPDIANMILKISALFVPSGNSRTTRTVKIVVEIIFVINLFLSLRVAFAFAKLQ